MCKIEYWRLGLTKNGRPMYEGSCIGGMPTQQKLANDFDTICFDCGGEKYHGIFAVGKSRDLITYSIDFANFYCQDCSESEYNHVEYEDMHHE